MRHSYRAGRLAIYPQARQHVDPSPVHVRLTLCRCLPPDCRSRWSDRAVDAIGTSSNQRLRSLEEDLLL
jgi:hypothetical protein